MIPNIYESPSESLNFQLQKLGFCGRKELKPLRAAGEKKIRPVKSSAFPGNCRTSGRLKVEGGVELWRGGAEFTKWKWRLGPDPLNPTADWAAPSLRGLEELRDSGSSNQSLSLVWK